MAKAGTGADTTEHYLQTRFDYVELYIMILAILCVSIITPIFSGEYQSGADSILAGDICEK